MKRGLLGLPLLILLAQVVSAQFFGGYGRFSLGDFFNSVDSSTIILTLLFLIFFALIFYALSKIFKGPYGQPNKGIAGVIAFAVSSLIIYGLYRTGFDISGLFYDLGFSSGLLYPIFTILFLIVAGLLIWKLKFSGFLMILGFFMILLTALTDIFYDKGLPFVIGIVLLVIGFLFKRGGRRVMGGVGRGALRAGRGVGRGALGTIRRRREARQQEQQRTQTRSGIRHQTHDTINEIRRIDRELKSIPRRISVANRQGNREQAMMLEQERIRLRQQRRDLEGEIRRFRREHSGNI